jgi:centromere protein C
MEDLEDFFKDDERTLVGKDDPKKIVFNDPKKKNSQPLRSPLPSSAPNPQRNAVRTNETDNNAPNYLFEEDVFDDALENQPAESGDFDIDMDIDDVSRGSIRMVNNVDYDEAITQPTQPVDFGEAPKPIGQKLFVSSDSDSSPEMTNSQGNIELESNTKARASSRGNSHRTPTGSPKPILSKISPLKSIPSKLHSPLQPSSRTASKLSKQIATNIKNRQVSRNSFGEYDPDDDLSEFEDRDVDSSEDSGYEAVRATTERGRPAAKNNISKYKISNKSSSRSSVKPANKRRNKLRERIIESENESENEDEVQGDQNTRGRSLTKFKKPTLEPYEKHIKVGDLRQQQSKSSSTNPETGQQSRRSSRVRVPPLAYWRNERQVFVKKMGEELPSMAEVVRVDEPPTPVRSRIPSRATSRVTSRRPSRGPASVRSRGRASAQTRILTSRDPSVSRRITGHISEEDDDEDEDEAAVANGEYRGSEWIKQGFLKVDTFEGHGSDAKSNRLIAWAPGTEAYSTAVKTATDNFKLAILFDKNREFIATGMMLIPPNGSKSLKSTDTTYFVFYCISGIVEVTLSGSVFLIKKGCSLEVPMGNFYQFVNKGKKNATLFFVQTRGEDVEEYDDDE